MTPPRFEIRLAGVADAELIASSAPGCSTKWTSCPDTLFEAYRAQCEARLRANARVGRIHRLARLRPIESPGPNRRRCRRPTAAHPATSSREPGGEIVLAEGRHAIVINVFTEPEWRRRGLATFCSNTSSRGRGPNVSTASCFTPPTRAVLFMKRLGFVQTNEMRFKDRLDRSEKFGKRVRRNQLVAGKSSLIGRAID